MDRGSELSQKADVYRLTSTEVSRVSHSGDPSRHLMIMPPTESPTIRGSGGI